MTPSIPPERHFGYVCSNCKAAAFVGRRYACWLCIDYQLCGNCYDSGQLAVGSASPDHKYFHPLEVHYTRTEYEFYFGGEPYDEANVPQSYKCALCDSYGFTSIQLYKHISDEHRDHRDFYEYFNILYTRYAADTTSPIIQEGESEVSQPSQAQAAAAAAASDFLRNGPRPSRPMVVPSTRRSASSREAVVQTRPRRTPSLQQQAMRVLEDLHMSPEEQQRFLTSNGLVGLLRTTSSTDQQDHHQEDRRRFAASNRAAFDGAIEMRTVRSTTKAIRTRGNVQTAERRGDSAMPKRELSQLYQRRQEDWVNYFSSLPSTSDMRSDQHQPSSKRFFTFANIMRPSFESDETSKKQEKVKAVETVKKDSHRFLCQQFEQQQQQQKEMQQNRIRFIEAILCSMLSDEQLLPVTLGPAREVQLEPRNLDESGMQQLKAEEPQASASVAQLAAMERFYRGLDNYNKWLAEFTSNRKEMNNMETPALPTYLLWQGQIGGIDSVNNEQDDEDYNDEDEDDEDEDDEDEEAEDEDDEDGDDDDDNDDDNDEDQETAETSQGDENENSEEHKLVTFNLLHGQQIKLSDGAITDEATVTESPNVILIDDEDVVVVEEVEDDEEDDEDEDEDDVNGEEENDDEDENDDNDDEDEDDNEDDDDDNDDDNEEHDDSYNNDTVKLFIGNFKLWQAFE